MGRRTIYTVQKIYSLRASHWERHYELRRMADSSGLDPLRVLNALVRSNMPEPIMEIDGSLYRPQDVIRAEHATKDFLGLPWTFQDSMCVWYWTDGNWQAFVRLFQALPDPTEAYYLTYDAERDGGMLVPMSSKPSRKPVDKPVDKSGTSQVQVHASRYNSVDGG